MKSVIIASTNPVKIACVKEAFGEMFPDGQFTFEGVNVSSCVSHQPIGSEETYTGAVSRVENSKEESPHADYWVGIEGGVEDHEKKMEAFAWIVIRSKSGFQSEAKTGTFMIPEKVADLIRDGKELGEADDIVFHESNSKQQMGAVGLLTGNVIDRTRYYREAVILALIPYKNPKHYHISQ